MWWQWFVSTSARGVRAGRGGVVVIHRCIWPLAGVRCRRRQPRLVSVSCWGHGPLGRTREWARRDTLIANDPGIGTDVGRPLMSYAVRSFPGLRGSRSAWFQGWHPLVRSVCAVGLEADNVPVYDSRSDQPHHSRTVPMPRCRFSSRVTLFGDVRCAAGRRCLLCTAEVVKGILLYYVASDLVSEG